MSSEYIHYSTDQLYWDQEDRTFIVDASDIGISAATNPPTACVIRNPKTGIEVLMRFVKVIAHNGRIHHTDGTIEEYTEVAGWQYAPDPATPPAYSNFKFEIGND